MGRAPDFVVAKFLADEGLGAFVQDELDADRDPAEVTGTLVTAGEVAPRPDDAIVVLRGIGGRMDSVGVQEDHVLEVQCRAPTYEAAWDRALSVSNALHLAQGDLGGFGVLMRVRAEAPPISLGRDADGRGGRWVTSQIFTAVLKQGENLTT